MVKDTRTFECPTNWTDRSRAFKDTAKDDYPDGDEDPWCRSEDDGGFDDSDE